MVDFISECLKGDSYEVDTAFNGADGLAKARSGGHDLLILDLMMPDMHGFDVCEALRAETNFKGLKILISSGKAYDVDKKAAKLMGADGYLVKPFSVEQLMSTVRGLVGA